MATSSYPSKKLFTEGSLCVIKLLAKGPNSAIGPSRVFSSACFTISAFDTFGFCNGANNNNDGLPSCLFIQRTVFRFSPSALAVITIAAYFGSSYLTHHRAAFSIFLRHFKEAAIPSSLPSLYPSMNDAVNTINKHAINASTSKSFIFVALTINNSVLSIIEG